MSSPYNNNNFQIQQPGFDPNTTFIQADPTTFRAVVQKLTGKPSATTNTVKLHERRSATSRKLEIQLNNNNKRNNMVMASPVSTLEFMGRSPMEEEERAIADKGFYFHPSPRGSTPGGSDPPQLLTLFPLSSPTHDHRHHHQR